MSCTSVLFKSDDDAGLVSGSVERRNGNRGCAWPIIFFLAFGVKEPRELRFQAEAIYPRLTATSFIFPRILSIGVRQSTTSELQRLHLCIGKFVEAWSHRPLFTWLLASNTGSREIEGTVVAGSVANQIRAACSTSVLPSSR